MKFNKAILCGFLIGTFTLLWTLGGLFFGNHESCVGTFGICGLGAMLLNMPGIVILYIVHADLYVGETVMIPLLILLQTLIGVLIGWLLSLIQKISPLGVLIIGIVVWILIVILSFFFGMFLL